MRTGHSASTLAPSAAPSTVARPRLGAIRACTYVVPDLATAELAYRRWLGYEVLARGAVGRELAEFWAAPLARGRPYVTLGPRSGEACWLRFIEDPAATGWRALVTHGWNVAEFVVQDVDALAASFAGSPFEVVGPPTPLQRFPMIRAMQVLGPFGECLYFTEVGPGSGLDLARAESFVGRVFIVVAGGPDLDALFATYARFDNAVDPPVATRVRVISAANGLPPDTEHLHGLVKLSGGTLIELDRYPEVTRPRAAAPDALPPGLVSVAFSVPRLPPGCAATSLVESALPRTEVRAALLHGAAGERIELLEEPDA